MVDERNGAWQRRPWHEGPVPGIEGWLSLNDDDLLYQVEAAVAGKETDQALLEVVRSDRHFFIRQEAAKKISDPGLLEKHSDDRHIGQILVRHDPCRGRHLPGAADTGDPPPRGPQGRAGTAPNSQGTEVAGSGAAAESCRRHIPNRRPSSARLREAGVSIRTSFRCS